MSTVAYVCSLFNRIKPWSSSTMGAGHSVTLTYLTHVWVCAHDAEHALTRDGSMLIDGERLYVHLYHGRDAVDEDMDDWGFHGPTLQCDVVTIEEGQVVLHLHDRVVATLKVTGDLVEHDGKFYGDFCVSGDVAGALQAEYDEVDCWGSHPVHTYDAWKEQVADGQTRIGYWEWAANKLDEERHEL